MKIACVMNRITMPRRTADDGPSVPPARSPRACCPCGSRRGLSLRMQGSGQRFASEPATPRLRDRVAERWSREIGATRAPHRPPGPRHGRKPAGLTLEGRVKPLSLRTNCREDARISSAVAGGLKLCSVLMLRHMKDLSPRRHSAKNRFPTFSRDDAPYNGADRAGRGNPLTRARRSRRLCKAGASSPPRCALAQRTRQL